MAFSRLSHGVQKAVIYLDDLISELQKSQEDALPSVRQLCKQAGVSYVTMLKAEHVLKERGILEALAGGRFYTAKNAQHMLAQLIGEMSRQRTEKPESHKLVWQKTADNLYQDILNGVYASGSSLPPLKELMRRYGSSYPTMTRAVKHLCASTIVEQKGRNFIVPNIKARQSSATIVLFGYGPSAGRLAPDLHINTFVDSFEKQCRQANIALEVIVASQTEETYTRLGTAIRVTLSDLFRSNVIGYGVIAHTLDSNVIALVQYLNKRKKPVAVFDEQAVPRLAEACSALSCAHIFTMSSTEAPGYTMGRYLLNRGHKRVAFFPYVPERPWALWRYQGMKKAYSDAGIEDMPVYFGDETLGEEAFVYPDEEQQQVDSFLSGFESWLAPMPHEYHYAFSFVISTGTNTATFLEGRAKDALRYKIMAKHFARALRDTSITAWVGANDAIAFMILDYLEQKHVDVPRRIAVAGFDNLSMIIRSGMTSYDFNIESAGSHMLNYIVSPRRYPTAGKRGVTNVPGFIVERSST